MRVIESIESMQRTRASLSGSLGCVMTMGALHEGHLALVRQARKENEQVVVTIFVNPTQFNDPRDLETYPRTLEEDSRKLEAEGVEYLFLPTYAELYCDGYRYVVTETELSRRFCGAHRPGHFDGVLTVVLKLLGILSPEVAYFGLKDYQQYCLIADMARALFLRTRIAGVPIVREPSGLAMSSRNLLISEELREKAPLFYRILSQEGSIEQKREKLTEAGFTVEYIEQYRSRLLAAVYLGSVRLIDNVEC